MNIFILEDDETRQDKFKRKYIGHDVTITDNVTEAKEFLSQSKHDLIFLDHDLGGETYVDSNNENTGYQLAKWIATQPKILSESTIIIHSLNPVGVQNMKFALPSAWIQPFAWMDKSNEVS
jgi:CheY-like chemotaxis protein